MSWDVIVMRLPVGTKSVDFVPDEEWSAPLGSLSEVSASLTSIFPNVDLPDPGWGILDGPDFSIEFNLGQSDPVTMIMLHVRGCDAAVHAIRLLCDGMGCRAFDTTEGVLIDFDNQPSTGLKSWRDFRNQWDDAAEKDGAHVIVDPKLPGIRPDAIVLNKPKKWWQFWK